LAILSKVSFGQIPTLDKLNLDSNLSPQCLDFNQDKICELVVLANGTMVESPNTVKIEPTQIAPTKPTPAYFNVIVIGYDVNKRYKVCYGEVFGIETECKEIEGKQFPNEKVWFQTDSTNEQRKFACVRDLETKALACEQTLNTPDNPQKITVTAKSGSADEDQYVLGDAAGPSGGGGSSNDGDRAIKCNDPNWNGEGTCIDPSVPKCGEGVDEVCP
jgi:hypothetical protein